MRPARPWLTVGPRLSAHPTRIGGTTRSFEGLLRHLERAGVAHRVIATNRFRVPGEVVVNAVWVLLSALIRIPRCGTVLVNVNPRGALLLAPALYLYARLWRRAFVFRMFGGDLIDVYEAQPPPVRALLRRTALSADLVLLQTRRLVAYFAARGANARHLPTARETGGARRAERPFARRLVYVGQIHRAKGIDHVLRFARAHAERYTVSLYGPLLDERYAALDGEAGYRGVVPPDAVAATLAAHDLLLLPTFHPGEGYPGIVVEAYAAGLPVVSTRWRDIPELVVHDESGLLVPPDDYAAFESAVLSVDDARYRRLARGARRQAARFDTATVHAELIDAVARLGPPPDTPPRAGRRDPRAGGP